MKCLTIYIYIYIFNQQEGLEENDDNDSDDEEDSINPIDQETVLSTVIQKTCEEPVYRSYNANCTWWKNFVVFVDSLVPA